MTQDEAVQQLIQKHGGASDQLQEALSRVLERLPNASGELLLVECEAELDQLRAAHRTARRRDAATRTELRNRPNEAKATTGRRRQGRKRRLPKGTAAHNAPGPGLTVVPVRTADFPATDTRRALDRLMRVHLRRARAGEPISHEAAELVHKLYELYEGVPPESEWVSVLLEQIREAKLQEQETQYPPMQTTAQTVAELTRKGGPEKGQRVMVTLTSERIYRTGAGRFLVRRQGVTDAGEPIHIAAIHEEHIPFTYPVDPLDRAQVILCRTRLALASRRFSQQLPDYADDPQLIAWLFERFGFAAGGGRNAVSEATLRRWLVDPEQLAEQIVDHMSRSAERLSDDEAHAMEVGARTLAARIVKRARTP